MNAIASQICRRCGSNHSNDALSLAVQDANKLAGNRIYYVPLSFPKRFAFSTQTSMLWNIKFGSTGLRGFPKTVVTWMQGITALYPNDDVREDRNPQVTRT